MLDPHLLAAKFHPPPVPGNWIARPQLNRRLDAGLTEGRWLTLVSAPAGFGKTACISAWVRTLGVRPVAWLSLDALDDDPARFFTYFTSALQRVAPSLGHTLAAVLRAGEVPAADVISTVLLNDLLGVARPLLVVLDDFHLLQAPAILQVMERLVTHWPAPAHLVLITREDPPLPLARLRANNQMTEVRAADLRFSRSEAEAFLHKAMGLTLAASDMAALETKTEGWVVGLQLGALAVRDRTAPAQALANLSGGHRFVLSYLTEEVFNRQSPAVQQFLLQTAILDRLHGDLCSAVTGRTDGAAMLEELVRANLFLVPLGDEQYWYRYHHLFADLLRELQRKHAPEAAPALHRRASGWYARAGMVSEAVEHALAAQDADLAVALLETHAMTLLMQGYAATVHRWVAHLPAGWEARSPRISLAFAWMYLLRGASAAAQPHLDRAQAALAQAPSAGVDHAALQAEWLVMQALLRYRTGEGDAAKELSIQAQTLAPVDDSWVQSLACFALASSCRLLRQMDAAITAYQQGIQYARAAGNLVAEMLSTVGLAILAFEQGQLHLAYEIAAPVIDRLEASDTLPPIAAVLYGLVAEVHYQWYEPTQARDYMARALQLTLLGGYRGGAITCYTLVARLQQLAGDSDAAAQTLQQAVDRVRADTPDDVRHEVVAQQVRLQVARERLDAAQLVLRGEGFGVSGPLFLRGLTAGQPLTYARGLYYTAALRLLLAQARAGQLPHTLDEAIAVAGSVIAAAEQTPTPLVALEAYLLRAQLLAQRAEDADEDCRRDYVAALKVGAPEEIVSLFVEMGAPVATALAQLRRQQRLETAHAEHVARILAAFGEASADQDQAQADTAPAALVEPLTARETEVLGLMASGLTYQEIAEQLVISLNTVRFHVKALYGKLGANNRTQAIARARALRLL